MLTFTHMIFYVADVPATVSFYEKAFSLKVKFSHESGMYTELDTGSTSLSFLGKEMAASNLPGSYQEHDLNKPPFANEITFTSSDISKDYDRAINAGATIVVEPAEKPWGQTVGYVRDPNGILIEIASEMK